MENQSIEKEILQEIDKITLVKSSYKRLDNITAKKDYTFKEYSSNGFSYRISKIAKKIIKKVFFLSYRVFRKVVKIYLRAVDPSLLEISSSINDLRDENMHLRSQILELVEKNKINAK